MNQKKLQRQSKAFPVLMDDEVDPLEHAGNNDSVCIPGSSGRGGACEQQQEHEHVYTNASMPDPSADEQPLHIDPSLRKAILRNKFRAFVRQHRIDQAAFRPTSMFQYPIRTDENCEDNHDMSAAVVEGKALNEFEISLINEAIVAGAFDNAPDMEIATLVSAIQADIISIEDTHSSSDDDCVFLGGSSSSNLKHIHEKRDPPIRNDSLARGILKQARITKSIAQKLRSKKSLETERHLKTSIHVKKLGIPDSKIEEVVRAKDPQIESAVCISIDDASWGSIGAL